MVIFKIFLRAIAEISDILIQAYVWLIFIACILSFVQPNPYNKFVIIITRLTDPAFDFVRKYIKTNFNGIDLAPLVLWIVLMFIQKFIIKAILVL